MATAQRYPSVFQINRFSISKTGVRGSPRVITIPANQPRHPGAMA
jgi:hypothetical protein